MRADAPRAATAWRRRLYVAFAVGLIAASTALVATAPTVEAAIRTYADDFATYGYAGSTGSHPWGGPWFDAGNGDPATGAITVQNEGSCTTDPCLVIGKGGVNNTHVERTIDLSGLTAINVSFVYQVHLHGGAGSVELQMSDDNGGSWNTLATYLLTVGTAQMVESIDISGYATAGAMIRFELVGGTDDSHINIDNLVVTASDSPPESVVISEFTTRNDNFIELYNAGSSVVDINGYVVELDGAAQNITVAQGGGPIMLPAGSHYLLATTGQGLDGVADQTFGFSFSNNIGLELKDPVDRVLDTVGAGSTPVFEGSVLPAMAGGAVQSYERLNGVTLGNCVDTGNNRADFLHNWGFANPQSMADPPVPCGSPAPVGHVVISEFRPTGPGGATDEFVEILNPTGAPVDISGWIFHITQPGLFRDYHVVPSGAVLQPGERYLLSNDAGPTPANAQPFDVATDYDDLWGDVVLKDSVGVIVDVFGYGDTANAQLYEGAAWPAYDGGPFDRSIVRRGAGYIDTDNNLFDFAFAFYATPTMTNMAPTFDQDLGDRTDPEGTLISIASPATEGDVGQTLTYAATGLPPGIDIDSATGDISGALSPTAAGVHAVTITVSDDGAPVASANDTFTWTVTDAEAHYLIAGWGGSGGGDDLLTAVDLTDMNQATNEVSIGSGTATSELNAAAVQPATGVLYGADAGQLGTLNTTTGLFSPTPSAFGTGNGSAGAVLLDDVKGIGFDPATGDFYAVSERPGAPSVLFRVNPVTGAMVPGVFAGDDYLVVGGVTAGAIHVADIAIHPGTGVMYGVFTDNTGEWVLGTIDPATGASATVGATGPGVRGLTFDDEARLWGIQYWIVSTLSRISLGDGSLSSSRTVDNGSFYEALAFSVPPTLNRAPVFDQDLLDRTDAEGDAVSLGSPATDPDIGNTLTYSAANLPPGLTIAPGTGLITGNVDVLAGAGSPYNVTIFATDDGIPSLQDTDTFVWTITDVNRAPSLDPITDPVGDELAAMAFTATGSDPDLDGLSFSLSGEPAGAAIDAVSGAFTWTPAETQEGFHTFDVILSDDGAPIMSDTQTITITVNETNQAPALVDPGAQANGEADVVNLAISASDADIPVNTLAYSATGLPPGLIIDPGTGTISGTVDAVGATGSPYSVTITVTDDGAPSLQTPVTFAWTITDTNRSPVLDPIADPSVGEQTTLTFTATASDPDFDGLTFTLSGEPAGAAIDPATGVFSWAPGETEDGVYTFDVIVTDDGVPALADSQTITATVNEVNRRPSLAPIADGAVDEQMPITFTANAADPDQPANTLTFSLTGAPAGAAINPASGAFTWTPTEAQDGVHVFDVVVTDDGVPVRSDSATVTITVADVNRAPQVTVPSDRADAEGASIVMSIDASDPDIPVNTLTYSATNLPPGLAIDPATGAITGVVAVDASDGSPYVVNVTVTDDAVPALATTVAFRWSVGGVNFAPVLDPIADATTDEQVEVAFTATSEDPDGDPLMYSLSEAPAGAAIDDTSGVFTWTPDETQDGVHTMSVVVTDGGVPALFDSQQVTITVVETNQDPSFIPPADREDAEGTSIALAAPASDPDIPEDTLRWTATGLPDGLSINPETGAITGIIGYGASVGSPYTVTLKVSDGRGGECVHTMKWKVTDTNRAPVLDSISPITAFPGDLVTFGAHAVDPDGGAVSYGLGDAPPQGAVISAATGAFAWQTDAATSLGTYTFSVTATDEGGAEGRVGVAVIIRSPNRAPVAEAQSLVVEEDVPSPVVFAASDADGDSLAFEITKAPTLGTLTGAGADVVYRPGRDLNGSDTIEFTVTDPSGLSDSAIVTITVQPVNDVPLAQSDRYTVQSGEQLAVDTPGVLANDSDVDDESVRAVLVDGAEHGVVSLSSTGHFTYQAEAGFSGEDSFTYHVVDGSGGMSLGSVTIYVEPPPPVSSTQRKSTVNVITDFATNSSAPGPDEPSSTSRSTVERTLVLMSRASGVAAQQMGIPFLLLIGGALAVLVLGRLRSVPLLGTRGRGIGTIQIFSAEKGFGVIVPDGKPGEIFVHISAVRRWDRSALKPGDRIKYRMVAGEHRGLATHVRRI